MNIKETLLKLKALTASPNVHEADTAQRLYDKLIAKHKIDVSDWDLLGKLGITVIEFDGWTEARLDIHHANDQQIEASLEYLIRNGLRKRREASSRLKLEGKEE